LAKKKFTVTCMSVSNFKRAGQSYKSVKRDLLSRSRIGLAHQNRWLLLLKIIKIIESLLNGLERE
jgi:hypothetical protein